MCLSAVIAMVSATIASLSTAFELAFSVIEDPSVAIAAPLVEVTHPWCRCTVSMGVAHSSVTVTRVHVRLKVVWYLR